MAGVYGSLKINLEKVFISYVRQDSKFVDRLVSVLEANDLDVWLDRNDLSPGQPWETAIADAIRDGWKFLSIHSNRRLAREKTQANTELVIAIDEFQKMEIDSGWLIPIRIDDSRIPDRPIGGGLNYLNLQICDFRNFRKGARKLLFELGIEEPRGLDGADAINSAHFLAPSGTWHVALEVLEEWQEKFGVSEISRADVASVCPDRTLTDLNALGLVIATGVRSWKLTHQMEDVKLALSVAIARVPAFSVAADMLRKNIKAQGVEIGAEISEVVGADWSLGSMKRNGGAYKRWTFALFPNFGGPKPGQENYLVFEAMRAKQIGHGRNTVLTEDVKRDISRWKSEGMQIRQMADRLGISANILYNFRRNFSGKWKLL